ncbi:aminopeptidase N-like [Electrophorus electricus]|uniref:aminopeptidase N-like n=1 Tax=Electrophorus electricus TaxID=8005 RepID=UPI0015D04C17|nr:aminopeptidase N-like [Electrophorus electricus]
MRKGCFSTMCVLCTVVATVSVATLIGIWIFQLLPSIDPPAVLWDSYRLPTALLPDTYHVSLWPRLRPSPAGIYVFTGNSTVVFRCVRETDLILIHSYKLNLTAEPTLTALSGTPAPIIHSTWMQDTTQYLVMQLNSKLTAGESYVLRTEFVGKLGNDLEGFYRTAYKEGGVIRTVVASKMHPIHTRKTFPCFDEPAMKAVFHITLHHDRGTVALSNSMEIRDKVDTVVDGTPVTITRFKPTEYMSPYLLSMFVSDYTNVQSREDTLQVRVWAPPGAVSQGLCACALSLTGRLLHLLQDYYNVTYPLPKLDQVTLPDVHYGGTENWGLITYREKRLFYEPRISSNRDKQSTATLIAHDLGHMWFGNLVTLSWWNEVWLSEGLALYMSYLSADYTEPNWNLKDLIVLNDIHRVFAVDALASSHPLSSKEEDIMKPEQISELFDTISYSKGAPVLRMLSGFLTEPVFVGGLRTYLQTFAYKNTVVSDLWDHLQRAVDANGTVRLPRPVREIMDRWVLQMGFPLVTINTRTGVVTQQHFLLEPDAAVETPSEFNYEWIVPITWMKSGMEQKPDWLLQRSEIHSDMKTVGDEWVMLNVNLTGYYRVNYDSENWERILEQLRTDHQVIPEMNRAQIVDDAFNLARAGIIPVALALNTTVFLSKETSYIPWESALMNLDSFYHTFDQTDVCGNMKKYFKKQATPLFEHFKAITPGWMRVPAGHTDQFDRLNAFRVGCTAEVDACLNLTVSWFSQWMEEPAQNPVDPNLRSTVYCSAIAAGGAKEWEFAWRMFQNTSVATEAERLMSALACTRDTQRLESFLSFTLNPVKIRKHEATSVIVQVARNKAGRALAWNFVRQNWKYIFTEYGAGSFSFAELIHGVTQAFSTQDQLDQLRRFKEDHSDIGFGPAAWALELAMEKTKANVKWVTESQPEVKEWLSAAAGRA